MRQLYGRRSPRALQAYSVITTLNTRIKKLLLTKREDYEEQLATKLRTNPKAFHKYISSMKKSYSTPGPLCVGGLTTSDPAMMSDTFDDVFSSQFIFSNAVPAANHQTTNSTLECVLTTPDEVREIIKGLKYDSSMGPDTIHPRLLKHCSGPLSQILSYIFNLSMLTGVVPDLWKLSYITPIHKKGSRSNALLYRPIRLSSIVSKVDEHTIVGALSDFCVEHRIISARQFGFVKGRSVEDSLVLTYDYVTRLVDRGEQCDLILFDFTKAFDKVSHPVLLTKLQALGIWPPVGMASQLSFQSLYDYTYRWYHGNTTRSFEWSTTGLSVGTSPLYNIH